MALTPFHPTVQAWFTEQLGRPTPPQIEGWPKIKSGQHTLIAAPTGSGKTLAAFLCALDDLLCQGDDLPAETQILYVSPLKALSNDVQKNLAAPLAELRQRDPSLPEIRVLVRSGDTPQRERAAMIRKPPHILVTTPESLYILLTSKSGQGILSTVRTVIVDEIHALARDKRGSHLCLSLERLEALARSVQRIGLSATQKPIEDVARFLCGTQGPDKAQRSCAIVDGGHLRHLDLALEVPKGTLTTVCSHETWEEIYERVVALIAEHRTTLVFTNTRKLAERIAAKLSEVLGEDKVTSHHGSLAKDRRLDAEQRLKNGKLRALVATASLELGIDIGDVDLVIQIGVPPTIATFLQRVGRAGHGVNRIPIGRIFPLTIDELICAAGLLRGVAAGDLDRIVQARAPLDILAQHIVAACVQRDWHEDELYELVCQAWPYRDLTREDFEQTVELHSKGRLSLIHRDRVSGRLMATRRARIPAITSGGAIGDTAQYDVILEPDGTRVGRVDEDFAVESSTGDIFQLGNTSWRVLRIEPGKLRVADAKGLPPTIPFWFGETPARSDELTQHTNTVRTAGTEQQQLLDLNIPSAAATQIHEFVTAGAKGLGVVPSQTCMVLERFFDESGGTQIVLHSTFGSRINRALGLALRKRFCRGFGFELQAAANEEAIVLSLGPMHSFPLVEVFDYLHPSSAQKVLTQALLASPLFENRWRWNVTRSLLVPRFQAGKRMPQPIVRMRAQDELAAAFPEVQACPENLDSGDLPVPLDHPLVRQTVEDCLYEAMDLDGMLTVLRGLRDGTIQKVAIDLPEPSVFARSILAAQPYSFLDDAPLQERRTQAVASRRSLSVREQDEIGALDADAVDRVKKEAWPDPRDAEEVHEALLWMGFVSDTEAPDWSAWLNDLEAQGRVIHEGQRWYATEASRDPKEILRGRLEALGPVFDTDPLLIELEGEGTAMRVRIDCREAWCNRRLLARIHRYTIDRLRAEIEPVTASDYLHFLAVWQHAVPGHQESGLAGLAAVIRQLSGLEVPAYAWESEVLPARVEGFQRDWIDQLTLSGEVAWGRVWGRGTAAIRNTPLCLMPRADLAPWLALAKEPEGIDLSGPARTLLEIFEERGAMFPTDLEHEANLLPSYFEQGLTELVARGFATCDSFAALRQLIVRPSRRRSRGMPFGVGRWALLERRETREDQTDFVLDRLLRRYGVIFRRVLLREKLPVPWRDLIRRCRERELRGDLRGGRFVHGFDGEQFALPEAITTLRRVRKDTERTTVEVSAADPLNLRGILTRDERVSILTHRRVEVG